MAFKKFIQFLIVLIGTVNLTPATIARGVVLIFVLQIFCSMCVNNNAEKGENSGLFRRLLKYIDMALRGVRQGKEQESLRM